MPETHPIEADANGVDGLDNSHFVPQSNRLAFGAFSDKNCAQIGRLWLGGNSGPVGEGFGDYWASSSRFMESKTGSGLIPLGS